MKMLLRADGACQLAMKGVPMVTAKSFLARLQEKLDNIEGRMMELLDVSTIGHCRDDPDSLVWRVAPPYHWEEPSSKKQRVQIDLKRLYEEWLPKVTLLIARAPDAMRKQMEELLSFLRRWIENENDWDVEPQIDANKDKCRSKIAKLHDLIGQFGEKAHGKLLLAPDTNALIKAPDPAEYAKVAGAPEYTFVILPTITEELDELKVKYRDEAFRKNVESVITRIKGLRAQGSLLQGVTVNKTVTVKAVATEPSFDHTLPWLDRENKDDKIIASFLELQVANLSDVCVIVTSDINLQNKAELADLPYIEPPS